MSPEEVVEAKHALAGLAEMMMSYYKELLEQGFTSDQAFRLVIEYQRGLSPS